MAKGQCLRRRLDMDLNGIVAVEAGAGGSKNTSTSFEPGLRTKQLLRTFCTIEGHL